MISFIDEHRSRLGVEPICRLLPIAPSTYYEIIAKRTDVDRQSARARRDIAMKVEIRRVFNENFQVYGVRKVWRQLRREGYDIARCTVARLMRAMGLQGIIRGKPVKTTVSDKAAPCPLDRVNRQFYAPAPNMLWLSDFTYVATWQGFVYVAFVIDAFARRIVGWRASRTAHAGFVLDALDQALHNRRPVHRGGLIHHSDRGVQYVSIRYSERLTGRASSLPSEASATVTTMLSPKRSTVSTRPRSSIGEDHGVTSKPWSSPRLNGSTGSTTAAFWSRSETFRPPRLNNNTMPCWTHQHWPHNLNQMVSSKAGAVQDPRNQPAHASSAPAQITQAE
jgi:putative transposase